jgi:hypothetical protein
MKKILTVLLIVSSQVVFAQWYVGGNAGVSFSNYKSKTPWKEVSNMGFTFGIKAYKQVDANYGFHIDLNYIQKGYYHKICNTITDKLEANYLEVPVMMDYTFIIPSLKNFKAHANLGFYTAYWISAKYKTEGFDDAGDEFDFKKSGATRFDIGPNAGGRIEYILNKGSISLDFKYELGLLDLQKKENDNTKNTNRAFIVGISYLKPLGR